MVNSTTKTTVCNSSSKNGDLFDLKKFNTVCLKCMNLHSVQVHACVLVSICNLI